MTEQGSEKRRIGAGVDRAGVDRAGVDRAGVDRGAGVVPPPAGDPAGAAVPGVRAAAAFGRV